MEWARGVLGDVSLSLAPPGAATSGTGVSLYLLELVPYPPLRGEARPPLQIGLRYLVTARSEDPEAAHALLSQLVFAAMVQPGFEVDLEPLPAAGWAAFGTLPQPSFMLRIPLRLERRGPDVPRVRQPITVSGAPITQVVGLILGPGDIPVAGARVELPALGRYTRSDARGRFRLDGVPAQPAVQQLRVVAKGIVTEATVTAPASTEEPAVIRVPIAES